MVVWCEARLESKVGEGSLGRGNTREKQVGRNGGGVEVRLKVETRTTYS